MRKRAHGGPNRHRYVSGDLFAKFPHVQIEQLLLKLRPVGG